MKRSVVSYSYLSNKVSLFLRHDERHVCCYKPGMAKVASEVTHLATRGFLDTRSWLLSPPWPFRPPSFCSRCPNSATWSCSDIHVSCFPFPRERCENFSRMGCWYESAMSIGASVGAGFDIVFFCCRLSLRLMRLGCATCQLSLGLLRVLGELSAVWSVWWLFALLYSPYR